MASYAKFVRRRKISAADRPEILKLTGCALAGILADHEHHNRFPELNCAQSSAEWAARYALKAWTRVNRLIDRHEKGTLVFSDEIRAYQPTVRGPI